MRIRILKSDAFCLAEYKKGRYEIGNVCVDDCCFDREIHRYVHANLSKETCISQAIPPNERFFFNITLYFNKKRQETCSCIGFVTHEGEVHVLNIESIIDGTEIYPEDHHKFLITPYHPSKNFFDGDFERSILTSDGVITLEDNQLIGVRDGKIEELDVLEVLDILSKGKTEKSPSYKQVRLQSVRKRPARPARGTIIYNEIADEFEIYGKNGWRTIKTEEI